MFGCRLRALGKPLSISRAAHCSASTARKVTSNDRSITTSPGMHFRKPPTNSEREKPGHRLKILADHLLLYILDPAYEERLPQGPKPTAKHGSSELAAPSWRKKICTACLLSTFAQLSRQQEPLQGWSDSAQVWQHSDLAQYI